MATLKPLTTFIKTYRNVIKCSNLGNSMFLVKGENIVKIWLFFGETFFFVWSAFAHRLVLTQRQNWLVVLRCLPSRSLFNFLLWLFTERRFHNGGWVLGGFQQNMEPFFDWMERKTSNKNISDGLHSWSFHLWLYIDQGHSHLLCSRGRFHYTALYFDCGVLQGKNFQKF